MEKSKKKKAGKKHTEKNKGGRPSKVDGIDSKQITMLAQHGFTNNEIALYFSVNISTVYEWQKKKWFSDALKKGKEVADERVERSLYERACGYTHPEEKIFCSEGVVVRAETVRHYPPDVTAQIFWLKNRVPEKWRDRSEVEHSGELQIVNEILQKAKARAQKARRDP